MVMRNRPPKGPGNQSRFGTPGTQRTAQQNVRTGGMDPYNNFAKQAQRQGRSAYQRSLAPQRPGAAPTARPTPRPAPAPARAPRPAPARPTPRPTPAPTRAPTPTAPQAPPPGAPPPGAFGGAGVPRTGYEMLGGLPHEELLGMNQQFGLSNLTQIPGELAAPMGMRPEVLGPTQFGLGGTAFGRTAGTTVEETPMDKAMAAKGYKKNMHGGYDKVSQTEEAGSAEGGEYGGTRTYEEVEHWEGTSGGKKQDFTTTQEDGEAVSGSKYTWVQDGENMAIMTYDEPTGDATEVVIINGEKKYATQEDKDKFAGTHMWSGAEQVEAEEEEGPQKEDKGWYLDESGQPVFYKAGTNEWLNHNEWKAKYGNDDFDATWEYNPTGGTENQWVKTATAPSEEDKSVDQIKEDTDFVSQAIKEGDDLGYEQEEMDSIKAQWEQEATDAYQTAYQQMARQYAMMGMTGSGAMMQANNALANGIFTQLMSKYKELDLANLAQIEVDQQELVDNGFKLISSQMEQLKTYQWLDDANMTSLFQWWDNINKTIGQYFADVLEQAGGVLEGDNATAYLNAQQAAMNWLGDNPNASDEEVAAYLAQLADTLSEELGEVKYID
jgi:hypothetical protein